MADRLASGEIFIDVNDDGVAAELRKIEAEYARTMQKIDGMEAEVEISADMSELRSDLKKAEALVKDYDKRIAAAENARSRAALKGQQTRTKATIASLNTELDAQAKLVQAKKNENKQLDLTLKRTAAIEKAEVARMRAHEAADRRRIAAQKAEQREIEKTSRLQEQQDRMQERASTRREVLQQRAIATQNKEIAALPKMRRQFVELANSIEKMNRAKTKAFGDRNAKLLIDLKIDEAAAKMDELKSRLHSIGEPPPVIDVHIRSGRAFGLRMRAAIGQGMNDSGTRGAARNAGILLGMEMSEGMVRTVRNLPKIMVGGLASVGAKIMGGLEGLSKATVRLGPFTATIKQALVGMSLFAPMILDVVGAMGALVAVLGSATLGVGALGAGFLGGAIPAALGMGLVIKDVAQEFTAAKKATKAYNDAVMKGKTAEAAKKLKELRAVMGNVSTETVRQFGLAQNLGKAWDTATKPGRASVWKGIGEAIQTSSDLMPMFARNTNSALDVAEKGVTKWMKALRGGEGQSVLDTLMQNFNASLGPIIDGLGSIIGYFGKVGAEASKFMPGISRTFKDWAAGLNATADGSKAFQDRIAKVVQSAKDVGNFFLSAGRLMKAFFSGGVSEGQTFTRSMTAAMDRWTAFLNTTKGQNQLGKFFKEAVQGVNALRSAFGPLLTSFVQWAASIAPFARMFFQAAGAVSKLIAEFLDMTALRGPVSALIATLGALWAVGKIAAATRAVVAFTMALLGMKRAAAGGAALSMLPMAGGGLGRGTADVAKATGKYAGLKNVARGVGPALLGVSTGAAAAGAAILASAYAGAKLADSTLGWKRTTEQANVALDASRRALESLPDLHSQTADAVLDSKGATLELSSATKDLNRLRREGKKGTDEYQQAELRVAHAKSQSEQGSRRLRDSAKQESAAIKEATSQAEKRVELTRKANDEARKRSVGDTLKRGFSGLFGAKAEIEERRKLDDLAKNQAIAEAALNKQRALGTLALLNQTRAAKGLQPIARQAATSLAAVSRVSKSLAGNIALKFSATGAGQVAASAAKSLKNGVPTKIVTKIVADSKNAEDAVKRLQAARLTPKKVSVIMDGGKEAVRTLQDIAGRKLNRKEQRVAVEGGREALALLEKIIGRRIPPKEQKIQSDAQRVIGEMQRLASMILPGKTQKITIETLRIESVRRRTVAPGADTGRRARGQNSGEASGVRLIGEGAKDEYKIDTKTGLGYKTNGPEFTRLGINDAIIPTEQKYRARGKDILKRAANELGVPMAAKGAYSGNIDNGYYRPSDKLGSPPKLERKPKNVSRKSKGFAARKKRAYGSARGHLAYIAGLKTAQDDWEREVSIRESLIQEPESLMVETGRMTVLNPETGQNEDIGPQMGVNVAGIEAYKASLQQVQDAFTQLITIIKTMIAAIPQAMQAIDVEEIYRKANIRNLSDSISRHKKIISARGRGDVSDADKDVIARHKRALKISEDAKTKEEAELDSIKEDRSTLKEDRREAGFDFVETNIRANKNLAEYNAVDNKASAEVASANESTAASGASIAAGSGGGGTDTSTGSSAASDQLSYGQQAALADSERANVLRQFGSNFAPTTADSVAAAINSAMSPASGAGPGGNALGGSASGISEGQSAGSRMSSSGASGGSTVPASGTSDSGGRSVTINNSFTQPPPDTHTFVKGMEFESQAGFNGVY